jgi:hypothetical protein
VMYCFYQSCLAAIVSTTPSRKCRTGLIVKIIFSVGLK